VKDDGACYHCGQPLPAAGAPRSVLDGEWRLFCCPGCEAVAQAIVAGGLGDYYRLRQSLPETASDETDADAFSVYDHPEVQAAFVQSGPDNEREAALMLEGIRCSACVWLNEETLRRLPGVLAVNVNYATQRATVRWDIARIRLSQILEAVAAIGYRAHPFDPKKIDAVRAAERRSALWRLFVAGFGMMQVMMYAIPAYIAEAGTMSADIETLLRWASLVLTLPVVLYSAAPFFRGAWRDLRLKSPGMDVPVALGIGVAFGASVWSTLARTGEVYFDSVAMFVFLLLAGRYLELRARHRAGEAIQYLQRLIPDIADRLDDYPASLASHAVPATGLKPGDVVLVKPGASVAADGVVLSGESETSEALLTGESRPLPKRPGDGVIGGSVNIGAALVVRVERVGAETLLSGIVRLIERAAGEKPRLAELADRAARRFVIAILLVALAAGVGWWLVDPSRAVWVAVAVLVVTCPCALSLATPVALTAATGELARRGFVITRAHAIEALARATDVVFDKTGTLTRGEAQLVAVEPLEGHDAERCLAIAATLEQGSEHPYARAFLAAARERKLALGRVSEWARQAGAGIEGVVDGSRYRLGSAAWVEADEGNAAGAEDQTMIWLADERGPCARFVVGDALRPEAAEAVRAIAALGKRVHLLSGDAEVPARAVALAVGISSVRARATPADKHEFVRRLQREGRRVAMVGDGINDAPVLAVADVSVAMAGGAYLSQSQADTILMTGDLRDLPRAIGGAVKTLRVIRQNLYWALAYNLIAVPLAVAGMVTPWLAGLGMSLSSLVVVGNALRLRRIA